jgi:hypothetical protein
MHTHVLPEIDAWATSDRAREIIDAAFVEGAIGVAIVASHDTRWVRTDLDDLHSRCER